MSAEKSHQAVSARAPLELGFSLDDLKLDERGLLPVVVQEISGGTVLMVAWADREAIALTAATATAHFWSRSRKKLWQKGETSDNVLDVEEILVDCDRDTLLYRAHPRGPTCHLGTRSCFEASSGKAPSIERGGLELGWLGQVIAERRLLSGDASSYTRRLLDAGLDRTAQKVGEEAVEVVIAALGSKGPRHSATGASPGAEGSGAELSRVVSESADLLYHLLVLLEALDIDPHAVAEELADRHRSKRSRQSPPDSHEVEP